METTETIMWMSKLLPFTSVPSLLALLKGSFINRTINGKSYTRFLFHLVILVMYFQSLIYYAILDQPRSSLGYAAWITLGLTFTSVNVLMFSRSPTGRKIKGGIKKWTT